MKSFFIFCLLGLWVTGFSQSNPTIKNLPDVKKAQLLPADNVMASTTKAQSPSFQAANWKVEAGQNPSNASAWLNYYLWTGRDKNLSATEKSSQLSQIFAQAENNVSQSSQYFLMKYLQSGKIDSAALSKAFDLSNDKATLYQYKIQYAIIHGQKELIKKYSLELNGLIPMPSVLYEYHYNVLMSADSNAIIYAQGLNDLVPLAFLQEVRNYRKDITLKYYDGTPIHEPNAYICLSLGADVVRQYPKAGYTGLLLKLSGASLQDLKRSIDRFDLRIMQSDNAIPGDAPTIYKNYIPSFLLFYKYLQKTNSASKEEWKFLLQRLAARTGDKAAIEKQLTN